MSILFRFISVFIIALSYTSSQGMDQKYKQQDLFQYFVKKTPSESNTVNTATCSLSKFACPVLSGFDFSESGPLIQIDDIASEKTIRTLVPIWGQNFSFEFTNSRYCIGPYDIETFQSWPCKIHKEIDIKYQRCFECNNALGFNPAFYNVDFSKLSPKQQKYVLQPHVVYLAYFAGDIVKVGTANKERKFRRLLEQGARAAFILSEFEDAYKARELEKFLVESGVLEGVTHVKKMNMFSIDYDFVKASKLLETVAQQCYKETFTKGSAFNLQKYYFDKSYDLQIVYPLSGTIISGTGVGLVGDIFIFAESTKKINAINLNKFLGYGIKCLKK